ncbi:DUF4468 domain-containing protein [Pelobacter propionicus]|uniref:DUF4468 domain-containing protein n=1 Tax=Pelobacter propionicus (strain DSM 2379 / NBRC 103807 / OttBd1) TaxID=338966 RepID=A1AM92_PELPD|nr:DUF4468 domain-containing protein [Pelobacter propionicus]ABK98462.1 hypothetical protein Ppro_0833 [Pelobacter propionicus DSM 2379]
MMRIMATVMVFALLLAGCAAVQPLPPEQLVIQTVVDAPTVSKERIFEKSKIWFAQTFRQSMAGGWQQNSTRTVIQYENGEKGVLIANAAILYPLGRYSEAYKEGWEVRFTLREEVKEGKARLTFSNLNLFVPTVFCGNAYAGSTSSYEKRLNSEEYGKVKPLLLYLAEQLGAYLVVPEKEW